MVLKLSYFYKKLQKIFALFLVTNFNTSPMPPTLENFSLDALNSEQKPSVEKPFDRAGHKPVDRRVNRSRF